MTHPCQHCRTACARTPMARDGYHFCSRQCKNLFWNQAKSRGAKLYLAAYRWRRNRKRGDFQELTRLLDRWIQDDTGKYNPLPDGIKSATRMV